MLAALAACAAAPPAMPIVPRAAMPPGTAVDAGTQVTPARHAAAAMVDAALAMLGQPYRFGGFAPGGFDCSGLVFYAARSADIPVPRTAQEQLASGRNVARSDLRTGDLVFMHLSGKELHVGIVVDPAHFVHAPSSGGWVRIDSLDAAPYAHGFLAARRLTAYD